VKNQSTPRNPPCLVGRLTSNDQFAADFAWQPVKKATLAKPPWSLTGNLNI